MDHVTNVSYLKPAVECDLQRLAEAFRDKEIFGPVSEFTDKPNAPQFGYFFSTKQKDLLEQSALSQLSLVDGGGFLAIAKSAFERLCDEPLSTLVFLMHMGILRYPYADCLDNKEPKNLNYLIVNDPDMEVLSEGHFYVVEHDRWLNLHERLRARPPHL